MAITRTAMIDDDGSGTTGTILNNAWKQELYSQIDGLITEGLWTPTLGSGGTDSGQTYSTQIGSYWKYGRFVHAQFVVALSNKGTFGPTVRVKGFPFPALGGSGGVITSIWFHNLAVAKLNVLLSLRPGETAGDLICIGAAGTTMNVDMLAADIGNTTMFQGTVHYTATT